MRSFRLRLVSRRFMRGGRTPFEESHSAQDAVRQAPVLSRATVGPTVGKAARRTWHWARLTLGQAEAADDGQRRYMRLLRGVLSSVAGRGVGVVISIISIPLTIYYLGAERYGLWIAISTLLAWFGLTDFGLGNGLTNALSEAFATGRRDLARSYVSTAFFALMGLMLLLGIAIAVAWPWLDWAALFNIHSAQAKAEIGPAIAVSIGLMLLNFPFSLITTKIYLAHQEGLIANVWGMIGGGVGLVAIIVVTHTQGGLVSLVIAFSGSQALVGLASTLWLLLVHKPWLMPGIRSLSAQATRQLVNVGGMFFVVQIAALLIFQTDNLIIAHFAGPDQVTPYSVAYRLFGYTSLLGLLIFPNLWPAYTEAIARRDEAWVRRTFRLNSVGGTALTMVMALPLVVFGIPIIRIWAGQAAVPPFSLMIWMAGWSVTNSLMTAISCLLSASGRIKRQMYYGMSTAVVNIALSVWWVGLFGITGVIAATVIAYALCNNVPAVIDVTFLLRRLRHDVQSVRARDELVREGEPARQV